MERLKKYLEQIVETSTKSLEKEKKETTIYYIEGALDVAKRVLALINHEASLDEITMNDEMLAQVEKNAGKKVQRKEKNGESLNKILAGMQDSFGKRKKKA